MSETSTFETLRAGGLRRDHVAMRLRQKALRVGTWNPWELDLGRDRADWETLAEPEQHLIALLASLFAGGEEAVTRDILPLLRVVANEGRLEEELFLTTFLWDEAKHVDFFDRFLREVTGRDGDLHEFHSDAYRTVFCEALPEAMRRLESDPTPEAQADASVTYNMIVEGVLAETGYHVWRSVLESRGLMPGTVEGITHLQQDEARHIRYGLFLLARLSAEHGADLRQRIETRMGVLLPAAIELIDDIFTRLEARDGTVPFGLKREDFVEYAMSQFGKRMDRIDADAERPLKELMGC